MVQIFNTLLETALDGNGDPISGAKLFVYEAGTTTKLTTYTDSALTTPATNPLVADSAGRFATIYGAADDYKFVLAPADDTDPPASAIKTLDNYTVITAASSFSGGINPAGYAERIPNAQTGTSYTLLTGDRAKLITLNNVNAIAVTIPQANSSTFPDGWFCVIGNIGAGTATLTPTTSTINTAASITLLSHQMGVLSSDGTNYCFAYSEANASGESNDVASAATTNLGSVPTRLINITGTTTITSFGSSASIANPVYFVVFEDALTLTHNATSLILPGATNITTVAGDAGIFIYEGSGNWRCMHYEADTRSVVRGGSGQNTFTDGQLLIGNSTGNTLAKATLTAGDGITITNGNGSITIAGGGDAQTFTSSDTWNKPGSGTYALVEVWGGGGGGAKGTAAGGGGGGAYKSKIFLLSDLSATETVTIGAGGAGNTSGGGAGVNGGASSFGSHVTAYGGSGGGGVAASSVGGAAGGITATATAGTRFNDLSDGTVLTEGTGSAIGLDGIAGTYGGGGGGGDNGGVIGRGGHSIYGGGGGGGAGTTVAGAGGTSVFGGNGGAGATSGTATAGSAPGGGGGAGDSVSAVNGADGARGEVRVYVF